MTHWFFFVYSMCVCAGAVLKTLPVGSSSRYPYYRNHPSFAGPLPLATNIIIRDCLSEGGA